MCKSKNNAGKPCCISRRFALFLAAIMIIFSVLPLFHISPAKVFAEETSTSSKENNLNNGSFEEGQTWSDKYKQPDQSAVPAWNTTAFQGKIELFTENTSTYIPGVTLKPTDGKYAAELNADEESTLYQNVKTSPSSVYEWGLDHGARNGTDTMALIIGPKQSVDPSKPSKDGRDQFMQMVDWLIVEGKTSVKTSAGLGEQLTVYSKKFAKSGAFEDNAGNNPFSLTPSTIYSEEWHIWIMASSKATSGTNPWSHYGSNAESSNSSSSSSTGVDLSKYYDYTVPAGQTETVFGFVSVGYVNSPVSADKAKTYGNFIDNIKFELYHPLSGSTTTHGSVIIGESSGASSGEGGSGGNEVTVDNKLTTYVTDGEPLKIQAIIKKADVDNGCEFVGIYITKQGENGEIVQQFLKLENVLEESESLTEEQRNKNWIKSLNDNGDVVYTYILDGPTSATDLHFLFVKSPTVTYDPNGGKDYLVDRQYNTDEAANVYSFKPATNSEEAQAGTNTLFIPPYVSHAAEGQNDAWKFTGWLLTGDTIYDGTNESFVNAGQLGTMLLPAEHLIACDYLLDGFSGNINAQLFKIYGDKNTVLTKTLPTDDDNNIIGVVWEDNGDPKAEVAYANVHKGLTMVAQWRWRQAIIPHTQRPNGTAYDNSDVGGTVEFTSVTDKSDENYNGAYNENGGKAYFAELNENVVVTATANKDYTFQGWYDESGNLIATNPEYSFVETKEGIKTLYAKFSNSVTQTYIRQVGSGSTWTDTTDDSIGTLDHYEYTDAVGSPISSTATAKSGYKFMGWYDSGGNIVTDGATLSYTTTENATYYARFSKLITQNYQRKVWNNTNISWDNTTDDLVGTLSYYRHTDTAGVPVSSKAAAGDLYDFKGWYDSSGTLIQEDVTLTHDTITDKATYYARFAKKRATQTFIRQIWNGSVWEETTNDEVAVLDNYGGVEDEIDKLVESKATPKSGYRFMGWYDSDGNKVANDMLKDGGLTISYTTTTKDATYYARFEKAYTLNVSKIDGDKSTTENKVPLAGAQFTLYQEDSDGDTTIVYNGHIINCSYVAKCETALNADETQATAEFKDKLTSDSDYYLVETRAPTGYRLLEQPLKITFDGSGNTFQVDGISKEFTGNTLSVELANYLTLHMPVSGTTFTGGSFAAAGISILLMAVIGLFIIKMNRYKCKNKL